MQVARPDLIHVVGGGVAGMAAALHLADRGHRVELHEAAPHLGGRCRSIHDGTLDNGNHILLTGNRRAVAFLRRIGALEHWQAEPSQAFPFVDGWLRPGLGTLLDGWTAGSPRMKAILLAALNTDPEKASKPLFRRALLNAALHGGLKPLLPMAPLEQAVVAPARQALDAAGVTVRLGQRVTTLEELPTARATIVALPPREAARLLGIAELPCNPIINLHFSWPSPPPLPQGRSFLGFTSGPLQWLFHRPDGLSVTISAANELVSHSADDLAAEIWPEIARLLNLPSTTPPVTVVKEHRATLCHTEEIERLRPKPGLLRPGIALAGDWTATGLPCSIESAVASGVAAAQAVT